NQSRYLAGLVSGIASHSNAVAIAEAAVRIRKPSQLPSASKRNPVAVVSHQSLYHRVQGPDANALCCVLVVPNIEQLDEVVGNLGRIVRVGCIRRQYVKFLLCEASRSHKIESVQGRSADYKPR